MASLQYKRTRITCLIWVIIAGCCCRGCCRRCCSINYNLSERSRAHCAAGTMRRRTEAGRGLATFDVAQPAGLSRLVTQLTDNAEGWLAWQLSPLLLHFGDALAANVFALLVRVRAAFSALARALSVVRAPVCFAATGTRTGAFPSLVPARVLGSADQPRLGSTGAPSAPIAPPRSVPALHPRCARPCTLPLHLANLPTFAYPRCRPPRTEGPAAQHGRRPQGRAGSGDPPPCLRPSLAGSAWPLSPVRSSLSPSTCFQRVLVDTSHERP